MLVNRNFLFRKNHGFQLVEPSVIPVVLSCCVLSLVLNLIYLLQGSNLFAHTLVNSVNVALMVVVVNVWFSEMRSESKNLFIYTVEVEQNILMGMLLFITSEVFLFVSVFWAFFNSSLCPSVFVGSIWPPSGIDAVSPWRIPLLNTLILVISGVTVNSYYYSLRSSSFSSVTFFSNTQQVKFNCLELFKHWFLIYRHLVVTVILGVFFLSVQVYEYVHSTFSISDGVYGSVFFMSTGLHGCHVLLGLVMLFTCLVRISIGDFDNNASVHMSNTCTVWYWHFVDVVWLFLFIFVYIWGY